MRRFPPLSYLFVLLLAFALGLVGTLAASSAVLRAQTPPAQGEPAEQRPASAPESAPLARPVPTVEC